MKIMCENCKKEMELIEQAVKLNGSTKIQYTCSCGWSAMVLIAKDMSFDSYIYNEEKVMKKYYAGRSE